MASCHSGAAPRFPALLPVRYAHRGHVASCLFICLSCCFTRYTLNQLRLHSCSIRELRIWSSCVWCRGSKKGISYEIRARYIERATHLRYGLRFSNATTNYTEVTTTGVRINVLQSGVHA